MVSLLITFITYKHSFLYVDFDRVRPKLLTLTKTMACVVC